MGSLADHITAGLYPDQTDWSVSDRLLHYFAKIHVGEGTPEGVVTAPIGSEYTNTLTGFKYMKTSGAGNTGWDQLAFVP